MANSSSNSKNREMAFNFISKINKAEGFDPSAVTREVLNSEGGKDEYLPLIWKKAWAREVYPLHRCHAAVNQIKDGVVYATAEFFIDNDPEKAFIGEGFAAVVVDQFAPDQGKAMSDACLKALGSAKTRAYTDAGFGLQFWADDCIDDMQEAAGSVAALPDASAEPEKPTPKTAKAGNTAKDKGKAKGAAQGASGAVAGDPGTGQGQMSLSDMLQARKVPVPEPEPEFVEPEFEPEPIQAAASAMDIQTARETVISSCDSKLYNGKTVGELFDNNISRNLLPKLFERTGNKAEKEAIKTLITSDSTLMAFCERNGYDFINPRTA